MQTLSSQTANGKPAVATIERARRYLAKVPPAISGSRGHDATFHAACLLVNGFALDPADALALLREWNTACQPPWGEHELTHKINSALAASHREPRGFLLGADSTGHRAPLPRLLPAPRSKPQFDPAKLARIAAKLDGADREWFAARSPKTPWNRTPASYLHALYREGERVLVFTKTKTQGILWTHPGLPFDANTLDPLREGHAAGVWFLAQPVNGEWLELDRLKSEHNPTGRTRRAEENVTSWRYAVIESDHADHAQWLAALAQLPLPIASLVTSGGDSIHALIRVDAASKAEFDDIVRRQLAPPLVTMGADLGAMTAIRLSRLACCWREGKHARQELLFLNPSPDGTPICELPVIPSAENFRPQNL